MAHSLLLNNTLQESNTCDISNEKSTRHVNISRLQKIRKLDANMSVRLCMNLLDLFIKTINDCTCGVSFAKINFGGMKRARFCGGGMTFGEESVWMTKKREKHNI